MDKVDEVQYMGRGSDFVRLDESCKLFSKLVGKIGCKLISELVYSKQTFL